MRTPMTVTSWLCAACMLLVAIPECYGQSDIEALVTGTRQARESIHSLSADFELRPDRGKNAEPPSHLGAAIQRVRWRQQGQTARWSHSSDFGSIRVDYLWKDNSLKVLSRQGSGDHESVGGSLLPQSRLESHVTSPWFYGLFVSGEAPHDTIDSVLQDKRFVVGVAAVNREGRDEKHLTFVNAKGFTRLELWIAPSFNYLVTKMSLRISADGSSRLERSLGEVKEFKPGIFFPTRGVSVVFKHGVQTQKIDTIFQRVSINEPVAYSDLDLTFPGGVTVADRIENKHYIVDSSEKPVPGSEKLIPVSKEEQLRLEALRPWYRDWRIWTGAGAGVVFLASAYLLIRRRWLAREAA